MPKRMSYNESLENFKRRFQRATGFSFDSLIRPCAFLAVVLVGTGLMVLYTGGKQVSVVSGIAGIETKQLTDGEQFVEVSKLPPNFSKKLPIEKIEILKSKIEAGEELASSGGHYAERANDKLVLIYGRLCQLQELEGINSDKTYERLAALRQQALAAGNEQRLAAADYFLAVAATSRLTRSTEQADFLFATNAVLNLDSKNLVNVQQINPLYIDAINLHDTSSKQDRTAVFLSTLSDKLVASPVRGVSNLGLNLKDHARYARFYAAINQKPYTTRESKLQFFREMFAEIENAPPQSHKTYRVVLQLIDRLLNKSEGFFAGTLTKRLRKAASNVSAPIKAGVDKAINNVEKRLAALGKTVDLSGSNFRGSPLQLPNGKPTSLLFYRASNLQSMERLKSVANSNRFNPWGTNVLVACVSTQSVKELEKVANEIGKFTVLDSATSSRLGDTFAIDYLPYHVSLNEDGKVIRLGAPTK